VNLLLYIERAREYCFLTEPTCLLDTVRFQCTALNFKAITSKGTSQGCFDGLLDVAFHIKIVLDDSGRFRILLL